MINDHSYCLDGLCVQYVSLNLRRPILTVPSPAKMSMVDPLKPSRAPNRLLKTLVSKLKVQRPTLV